MDYRGILLICAVLTLLGCATAVLAYLKRRPTGIDIGVLSACQTRLWAWWILFGALTVSLLIGTVAVVCLFGVISFYALREYVTLSPTRPADHRTLVGVFFVLTPCQFILVGVNSDFFLKFINVEPYWLFSLLIPSLAFLILPATVAISGDPKFFLERIAKLQVGLLICVYSLSFVPAMMTMELPASKSTVSVAEIVAVDLEDKALKPIEDATLIQMTMNNSNAEAEVGLGGIQEKSNDAGERDPDFLANLPALHKRTNPANLTLLFFFVFLTQLNDFAQFFWSLVFPKHKIAPKVNSNKTTEGFLFGLLTTALLAASLTYFTPFTSWLQAAWAGVLISVMGFAGNMTISAIKRDHGVGEHGVLVEGHCSVLDRIDSLCFAAPIFFHYVRFCLNS